jgi:hypothetical protein
VPNTPLALALLTVVKVRARDVLSECRAKAVEHVPLTPAVRACLVVVMRFADDAREATALAAFVRVHGQDLALGAAGRLAVAHVTSTIWLVTIFHELVQHVERRQILGVRLWLVHTSFVLGAHLIVPHAAVLKTILLKGKTAALEFFHVSMAAKSAIPLAVVPMAAGCLAAVPQACRLCPMVTTLV